MEKRRVVITGMGTVNPIGNSVEESWAAAKAGTYGKRAATANHYRRAAYTIGVHWLPLGRSAGWLPEWERERGPPPRI